MINAVKTAFAVEKTVPVTLSYPVNDGDILIYDTNSGTFINQPPADNTPQVITTNTILSNILDGSAIAQPNTLTAILDSVFTNEQGSILARGYSGWEYIVPGTAGQMLKTNGLSVDPSWATPLSEISTDSTLTGGPITTTGTLGINLSNSNTWLAQQNFDAGMSLDSGSALLFNGISDTNWRIGLGIDAFTTTTVGSTTSIQLVVGQGFSGPDGFAVGQAGGQSLFEITGDDGFTSFFGQIAIHPTAIGGTSYDLVTIKGISGQTTNYFSISDTNSNPVMSISSTGDMAVSGNITESGNPVAFDKVNTITTNTTIDGTYRTVLVDATSGPITILVHAIGSGITNRTHNIKKIDSTTNNVYISVTDNSNIDGVNAVVLDTQYQARTVQAGPTQWWII